jgi:hypothetical protein
MSKLYRVEKDTFMWVKGAILKLTSDGSGYQSISDIWDKVDLRGEYITKHIIENAENADTFVRVHDVSVLGKVKYLTTEAARKAHNELYKSDNKLS